MTILICGGSKSGKSMYAQRCARELAGNGKLYYLATMIPRDAEDIDRIANHVAERRGWGFETVECPRAVTQCLETADKSGTFLLDSITALLSNEMFRSDGTVDSGAARRIADELQTLSLSLGTLVLVSDDISSDTGGYDELTEEFRQGLAYILRRAASFSQSVVEVCLGRALKLKTKEEIKREEKAGMELIIGGAHQGKLEYAREKYALANTDICYCTEDAEPDFSCRCLNHIENYALYCLRKCKDPWRQLDLWLERNSDGILIGNDIFCGVVPIDKEMREWREAAGRLQSEAAKRADKVTRLFCGLAQSLK